MLTTTFRMLRNHKACKDRYGVLRKAIKRGDDEPITLLEILDSNGVADAIWALRAVPEEQSAERDRLARLYACWCARQVWHLLGDRARHAVEVAERLAASDAGGRYAYACASAAAAGYADAYDGARDAQAAKFREMFG